MSTVDSGNLAGALMALAEGLRQAERRTPDAASRRAAAAAAFADGMDFRFLYDPKRRLFSIGYRLADAEGPGRLDASYYDLLASEARLASFIAIARGELPETHWFHLGRLVTSVARRAHAAVLERHAVRVPDAAAAAAQPSRDAARPDLPHGRAPRS